MADPTNRRPAPVVTVTKVRKGEYRAESEGRSFLVRRVGKRWRTTAADAKDAAWVANADALGFDARSKAVALNMIAVATIESDWTYPQDFR